MLRQIPWVNWPLMAKRAKPYFFGQSEGGGLLKKHSDLMAFVARFDASRSCSSFDCPHAVNKRSKIKLPTILSFFIIAFPIWIEKSQRFPLL